MLLLKCWIACTYFFNVLESFRNTPWLSSALGRATWAALAARGAAAARSASCGGRQAAAGKSHTTCFRGTQPAPRSCCFERKPKSESKCWQAVRRRGPGGFPQPTRPAPPHPTADCASSGPFLRVDVEVSVLWEES